MFFAPRETTTFPSHGKENRHQNRAGVEKVVTFHGALASAGESMGYVDSPAKASAPLRRFLDFLAKFTRGVSADSPPSRAKRADLGGSIRRLAGLRRVGDRDPQTGEFPAVSSHRDGHRDSVEAGIIVDYIDGRAADRASGNEHGGPR